MQVLACCPLCSVPANRIHSHYHRTLKDLPCVSFALTFVLQVCKFFCLNPECKRRIFTERLPHVTAPWARRTSRLAEHLRAIGLSLGGAAGARLSHSLGIGNSRNTVLRVISALPLPAIITPKILGVDDFALRKGHNYGTILVDLERHQAIALLPDREADTLARWLKEHPGVEILSRDRSKTYKRGMTEGAPDAVQVADRFHLLKNLEEVLENIFKTETVALKAVETAEIKAVGGLPIPILEPRDAPQLGPEQSRARRLEKYEQTHVLREKGHLIQDIAHHLSIGKRTVYKYLAASSFPERQPHLRTRSGGIDRYKPYLFQQWNEGQQEVKQLFQSIQLLGYKGSYRTVTLYVRQLRQSKPQVRPARESLNELSGRGPVPAIQVLAQPPLTARRAAWLVLKSAQKLTPEEKSRLVRLSEHPALSDAIALTQGFLALVRQRLPQNLDTWLEQAKSSSFKLFQSFAKGLKIDYDAVKAGVTLDVSNGQVEGQNNRVKMLKRQMYGRAGLGLLARRLILKS
jgi:transposase